MDELRPIAEVARAAGIPPKHLIPYGASKAKVALDAVLPERTGKLIVVTGVTPTPAGEGKTTTTVALTQGLGKIGKKAAATLREPSLGPIFGIKGGGTGGGKSRVVPEDEINVHFTGDAHAVGSAHNLLGAIAENAAQRGLIPGISPQDITWRRVVDIEDRALRSIVSGLGGSANAPLRESGFDIVTASEIMATLALSSDLADLRARLGRITVASGAGGKRATASDVGAVGSLMALLRHALIPNLVQTLEGQPAFVHTGPFGNIAHGCSSVVADRLALGYADYVVTEAGFGADLGFEKFMHIKCRSSGLRPSAAVLVGTARAMKHHGGVPASSLDRPDPFSVRIGTANLQHMIGIIRAFGLPVVVAVNHFPTDTPEETVIMQDVAIEAGASAAVVCSGFADGGDGATELAEAVVRAAEGEPPEISYLYPTEAPIREKALALAKTVYGAADVRWSPEASRRLDGFERQGLGGLPVCMAKTPLSISHDSSLKNRPSGYTFEISDVRASTGAGFVYPVAGNIVTMPGLPKTPRALDVDAEGNIVGL